MISFICIFHLELSSCLLFLTRLALGEQLLLHEAHVREDVVHRHDALAQRHLRPGPGRGRVAQRFLHELLGRGLQGPLVPQSQERILPDVLNDNDISYQISHLLNLRD